MELGLYASGDLVKNSKTGKAVSGQERIRQMLEMVQLAEDVGLDILGVGEHHGLNFVNSATATTMMERLPNFIKVAKNRVAVLKANEKLMKK